MNITPKFQEEYASKIPALMVLSNLGWSYISATNALTMRNGQTNHVVLRNILRRELAKREFRDSGDTHTLSEKSIEKIIDVVCQPALNEGLLTANERMYNHLVLGVSVTEFINGKKVTPTIPIIDWDNMGNNDFSFTEEFKVMRSGGAGNLVPDIVCFVNGIPLVVIEAKRPSGQPGKGPTVKEGISQTIRNQRVDEIPQLFAYSQIVMSISGFDAKYGTCDTNEEFWAGWTEEQISDATMLKIKNKQLTDEALTEVFRHRKAGDKKWFKKLTSKSLELTQQDRLLISLLSPKRLLEMTRFYIFFDRKFGKIIARHQQYFAIQELITRLSHHEESSLKKGGVIWHTTGSGKSFTMVLLSKAMILHPQLKNNRLVIITDRTDLETQLSKTFNRSGEFSGRGDYKGAMSTSGKHLAEQIGHSDNRIIFSLIHKFNSATKLKSCYNDSPNIIVLIDEGHRSQGGENHERMRLALPNAAFVAFTGTPLLKDDKTTNKFGPIVHAYTMQQAVADGAVTPLLYEERVPDLDVNERAIDAWFERITVGLSEEQVVDLKRKYTQKGHVYKSDDRIRLIALDIANHFHKNVSDGLKAQLACDSKLSAIKYKKYLDEAGLFESAVVISPPDTREGNTDTSEENIPEVTKWWQDTVGQQEEKKHTESVVKRFEQDEDLKMLIVVDKLLTGFDEPRNAVLYIDKPLKQHNLIQAIARVNRLHRKKQFGYLIDYRGILAELDTTIAKYRELADRTQAGYDVDDIEGLYHQMSTEYKKLPQLYKKLWAFFDGVNNKLDIQQLKAPLIPKIEERHGQTVDVNLKKREDFYEALTEFSNCLKVALQSATFYQDTAFTETDRYNYKSTVKALSQLRQILKADTGEAVQYDEYNEEIKKLLDRHVVGVEIKADESVYNIEGMGESHDPEEWSKEKTKNERDIIKTRIAKKIEQNLNDDPYAQEAFSKLLKAAIEEAEKLFDQPIKQYLLFKEFEEKLDDRQLDEIPADLSDNRYAQAFYGVFIKELPDVFSVHDQQVRDKWVAIAIKADEVVTKAVTEYSINPRNIESNIRKSLLPLFFSECKSLGKGVPKAKSIVEQIVDITRVGTQK